MVKATNSADFGGSYDQTAFVDIRNGKIDSADLTAAFENLGVENDTGVSIAVNRIQNFSITKSIKNGALELKYKVSGGDYVIELDYQVNEIASGYLDNTLTIGVEINIHWSDFLDTLSSALAEAAKAAAVTFVIVAGIVCIVVLLMAGSVLGTVAAATTVAEVFARMIIATKNK